jgi:hypothetical protein
MFRILMGLLVTLGLAFAGSAAPARAETAATAELKEWFHAEGTAVFGPVGLTELRQLAMATIKADTQVYVQRNGWREAKDHPELADLFPAAAAPVAPVAPAVPAPPPPPVKTGPSQAELNAKALSYLQGTWTSEGPTQIQGIPYRLVVIVNYGANNILTGTMTTYEMSGALFLALPMEGTYQVQAIGEDKMSVSATWRYNIATGPTGNDSVTNTVRIVDANTLQGVDSGNLMKRTN